MGAPRQALAGVSLRAMAEPFKPLEYVGFIWWGGTGDDWAAFEAREKTGVLLYAANSEEAGAIVEECYGEDVRFSIWNEERKRMTR